MERDIWSVECGVAGWKETDGSVIETGSAAAYIRQAEEEDIERILEIERESISPPWTHGALLSEIYRDDSFVAVAVTARGGSVAVAEYEPRSVPPCSPIQGFVILRRVADEGELFQIAVGKAARRTGIADALMAAALRYAGKSSLRSIYLEVRKGNAAAFSLYKKHGFNQLRQRKDYYNDPVEDAIVMMKDLL